MADNIGELLTAERPRLVSRNEASYGPGTIRLPEDAVINIKNRSFSIVAEVDNPVGNAEGVLVTLGGERAGTPFWFLELRESRNAIAKGRIGIEGHNRFAPRPRDGVSGCMDGLFSARVGDSGWLHPLPLRGEPQGAALALRTQHSPGSPPIDPAGDDEGSGRLSAIGGNGRIGF